jgi:hypothetical protein
LNFEWLSVFVSKATAEVGFWPPESLVVSDDTELSSNDQLILP